MPQNNWFSLKGSSSGQIQEHVHEVKRMSEGKLITWKEKTAAVVLGTGYCAAGWFIQAIPFPGGAATDVVKLELAPVVVAKPEDLAAAKLIAGGDKRLSAKEIKNACAIAATQSQAQIDNTNEIITLIREKKVLPYVLTSHNNKGCDDTFQAQ